MPSRSPSRGGWENIVEHKFRIQRARENPERHGFWLGRPLLCANGGREKSSSSGDAAIEMTMGIIIKSCMSSLQANRLLRAVLLTVFEVNIEAERFARCKEATQQYEEIDENVARQNIFCKYGFHTSTSGMLC